MPYPKHLINEGETVALDLHPHWWFFSKHIITGIPLLIALVGVFSIGGDWGSAYVWSAAAIVWAIWLGIKCLDWQFTHFVVTDERVVSRTGVLAKRGVEIPLDRIANINFRQGIWERVIGAGDLSIESAGREGDSTSRTCAIPTGSSRRSTGRYRSTSTRRSGAPSPWPRRRRRRRPRVDPGADPTARPAARPGPHHAGGVRGQEGPAPGADVATATPRVVSLVPSATESLRALGIDPVACTRFCEQPDLPTVGGTKNPDVDAVVALAPTSSS